jgi:hypothetical protein
MTSYRLYFFRPRSHGLVSYADFEAQTDEAARERASGERGELAEKLWRGHSKLAEIAGTDLASTVLTGRLDGSVRPAQA